MLCPFVLNLNLICLQFPVSTHFLKKVLNSGLIVGSPPIRYISLRLGSSLKILFQYSSLFFHQLYAAPSSRFQSMYFILYGILPSCSTDSIIVLTLPVPNLVSQSAVSHSRLLLYPLSSSL